MLLNDLLIKTDTEAQGFIRVIHYRNTNALSVVCRSVSRTNISGKTKKNSEKYCRFKK